MSYLDTEKRIIQREKAIQTQSFFSVSLRLCRFALQIDAPRLRLLGWLGLVVGAVMVGLVIAQVQTGSHRQTVALMSYQTAGAKPTATVHRPLPRQQRGAMFLYLPQMLQQQRTLDAMQLTYGADKATQPALAPDREVVAYLREGAGQSDLYGLALSSGVVISLTQNPAVLEETPVFSPDGRNIAFASNRGGDWDIYLVQADGRNLRLGVGLAGSDEVQPAFTPDGEHLLFSSNRSANNWEIYSATISSTVWVQLTNDPAVDRFPTLAADGATIAFRREFSTSVSNTVNSEIYMMSAVGSYSARVTDHAAFDGYPVVTPDGSGIVFVSDRSGRLALYSTNLGGITQALLDLPADWQAQTPRLSADGRTLLFAAGAGDTQQIYSRAYASPLVEVGARGFAGLAGNCDWEAGVLAYGWAKAWRATGDPAYRQWVVDWANGCLTAGQPVDHVNDGLLGYAALIAYQATDQQRYLTFAQQVADYLLQTAKRTTDGTLAHLNDDTVWDDTLVSIVPFLVEMGQVSNNSHYGDEAASQMVKHAGHLQNAQSRLYHHAWQESTNSLLGAVYWCRGNSWPLLAGVELLATLPANHPQRATILADFQRQAQALLPLQATNGLWPTVVDQPAFYHESSGSAMIAAALLEGVAAGWLDRATFYTPAQRARLALWRQVQADGTVTGVSAPTGPMRNAIDYNVIPLSPFELYGQGAMLLLGAASLE